MIRLLSDTGGQEFDQLLRIKGFRNMSVHPCVPALPDVIVIGDTYTPDPVETVLALEGWESIPAIAEKQVFAIDGDAFNQPNQYVMNSACEIAKQIYPDIYADLEFPF